MTDTFVFTSQLIFLLFSQMASLIPVPLNSSFSDKKIFAKQSSIRHATVLILGGGIAGVAVAHTLQSHGMKDFLLLEASQKLGGRISNTNFFGRTIEEGANWIHGMDKGNNPILLLAQECGLKIFNHNKESKDSLVARNSEGRDITEEVLVAIKAQKRANEVIYDEALDRGVAGGEPPDCQLSPNDPLPDFSVSTAENELAGWKANSSTQITAEWCIHDWLDVLPPHKASLLGNVYCKTDEVYGEGDAMVVDTEGYAKIVRHLAAQTFVGGERDPRLLLRETVSEVHLSTADDECSTDCGVYVRTAEGHEYSAQYTIITFSNAVILSGNVRFIPKLPKWKLRALSQCETAACTKIFVKFADDVRPFWDSADWIVFVDSEPVVADDAESLASSPSKAANYDETHSKNTAEYMRLRNSSAALRYALKHGDRYTRGYYTGWTNITCEGMFPKSNILLVMLMDEMAKSAELKSEEELKIEITAVLRQMYGKEVPEPLAIHRTKWHNNPLTQGAIHSLHYGSTHSDIENLSRSVNNLHFAGDGTTVEFLGTVHGAYITGVQQARAVIEKIRSARIGS